MRALIAVFALALAACASAPAPGAITSLDPIARAYVRLALEIDTHEEGYVDSYSGPPEWKTEAEAHPRGVEALKRAADDLRAQVATFQLTNRHEMQARRAAYLDANLVAARFRLDMIGGTRAPFLDEAERLYAVRPVIRPLESFEPVLAELERLLPGEGALPERTDAFTRRYAIPPDRLDAVMRAAIAECRRRTLAHIDLPADERFTLEFVTGQPWAGYNWYQGDFHSLIQVNTDQPLLIDRAVDLGCHEGYPGHHTLQTLLDQRLVREQGWIEFTVFPLYSPTALLAEGSGNAGVWLAFPGDAQERFTAEVLFPLAGLDPATAPAYFAYRRVREQLEPAGITLAQLYLDGDITRERAIEVSQRYEGRSRASAEQRLRFFDAYRSYILNYSLGEQMVRDYLTRAGADQDARWAAFERLIAEPTLPSDLEPPP